MEKTRKKRIAKRKSAAVSKKTAEYSPASLPFNLCDRNCERCEKYRQSCKVYQEESQFKLQCIMDGRDPQDPQVVLEHVGRAMQQAMEMLKKKLKKEGIEITEEDMSVFGAQEDEMENKIEKHPLHKKCHEVSEELDEFISTFRFSLPNIKCVISSIEREVKELYFYGPMIMAKTTRALLSKIEEEVEGDDFGYSDAKISAALGYRALLTSRKSIKNIKRFMGKEELVWSMRLNTLLANMERLENLFKCTFVGIEKHAEEVIFHGRHD